MRVQHNIAAMNAYRNYNNNSKSINRNLEKLSSGYRINRAGDDAAGLAISEKMRAQISGLEVAQKNAKDGISLVQTAEASLTEVQDMLNRMYSLAEQSANGTYAGDGTDATKIDRDQLNAEVKALRTEIDRIASTANFNGTKLLDGSLALKETSSLNAVTGGDDGIKNALKNIDTSGITDAKKAKDLVISIEKSSDRKLLEFSANNGYTIALSGDNTSGVYADLGNSGVAGDVTVTISKGSDTVGTITLNVADAATVADGTATISLTSGVSTEDATTATAMGDTPTNMNVSANALVLWIGAEAEPDNALTVNIDSIKSADLAITDSTVDISTQSGALSSLRYIEAAIDKVSSIRGELGATQNRLEHTINNLSAMQENMQDAESTIRDTDVAEEMMKYTKNSILVQSAQAMLAQANQLPQGVLQLLQ